METNIQLFNSPQFGEIRIAGTPDNPMFCLADVCNAIGIANARNVKTRLDEDDVRQVDTTDSMGRTQLVTFITESGLYDVIIRSDNPNAKPFRKWVTSEVLPQIRKTGGYVPAKIDDTPEEIMAKALLIANKTMEVQKQRIQMLEGEKNNLVAENMVLAPKAKYTDEVLQSQTTLTFTEIAKELNFRSGIALIKSLLSDKIIFRQGERYLPFAKYSDKGYFASRTHRFFRSDGRADASVMTVVTEKGRLFLHNHYNVALKPVEMDIDWSR